VHGEQPLKNREKVFSLTIPSPDDKIQAQENIKEKQMTTLYRVELHSEGSTVYLLTNKGWVDIVHFKENAEYRANAWVKNQERLDRMDNA
jgi:hypothetical protein